MFRSSRLRQSSSGLTSLPSAVSPAVSAPAATTRNGDGIGELNNDDDTDGCDDQVRVNVPILQYVIQQCAPVKQQQG